MKDQIAVDRYIGRLNALIKRKGKDAIFVRYKKNGYNEITEEIEHKQLIRGLVHTGSVGVTEGSNTSAKSRNIHEPKFLIVAKAGALIPVTDDYLYMNNKTLRVVGVEDLGLNGFAYDVSLEVRDYGAGPV